MSEQALKKRIKRERAAREAAEQLLENKSKELYEANQALLTSSKRLEHAQSRLSGIWRSVPSGIFTVKADGQVIRMNPAAGERLGLTAEAFDTDTDDVLKQPISVFSLFADDDDTQAIIKSLFSLERDLGNGVIEIEAKTLQGTYFAVELAMAEIDSLNGKQGEQVWAFRDIVKRKEAEKDKEQQRLQLAQQVAQFDAAINAMDQGLAVFDDHHNMVVCNQPYIDLYQLPEELTRPGVNFDQLIEYRAELGLVPNQDLETVKAEKDLLLAKGGGECTTHHMLNGRIFEISNQVMPMGGWLSTHRDMTTAHKKAALERQRNKEESQAQKLEALGTLASGVAHEINTPVQYISDNVRFLQESIADMMALIELYEQLAANVRQAGNDADLCAHIEKKIQDIDLDFMREELHSSLDQSLEGLAQVGSIVKAIKEFSHPGESEKSVLDINKAVEMTATVSRNQWKYVAELETELDPNVPMIAGFPSDINQVLLNMVVNAADAIAESDREGLGKIAIRTSANDEYVRIEICDTGCGICDEIADKIYDPFFTTKDVGKGSGQGLAICFSIIQNKHGGTIHFKSIEGQGTGFVIKLPITTPMDALMQKDVA